MEAEVIQAFAEKKIKAKDTFSVQKLDFDTAYGFIKLYHYLGDVKPFGCQQWGLYHNNELVGVSMFGAPQGTLTLKGWFGAEQKGVYELVRLAMLPELNGTNATSFLLSASIRGLKKIGGRAVITLADAHRHVGSIYQVCNFKYYGMSNKKSDFYVYPSGEKRVRGTTRDKHGVWVPRTRKHRYAFLMDKSLHIKYEEQEFPKKGDTITVSCCSNGIVYDSRYNEYFTCPVCNKPMRRIEKECTNASIVVQSQ